MIFTKFDAIENFVGSANAVETQMRKYFKMPFILV